MGELANCSRCGTVFVKKARDICQSCFRQEAKDFDTVYAFLRKRKNREATLPEIVEATDVEEVMITKFIKEKRLRASEFPKLSYPCEKCSAPISTGKLCYSCTQDLKADLDIHEKIERKSNEKKQDLSSAYYSFKKNK